jgi:RNA polymerase sigma-70 factor (ECF subfamily)
MDADLASNLEPLHADAFGWALHCCRGDVDLAQDTLQSAYLKAVSGRLRPRGASSLKTWWFGVIRFTAHEEFRRRRSRERVLLRFLDQGEAPPAPPSPARQLELDEDSARLRTVLATLPARQAEVLHLVFYQDCSLAEAAGILGITVGSVRQHYDRGKAKLRAALGSPAR